MWQYIGGIQSEGIYAEEQSQSLAAQGNSNHKCAALEIVVGIMRMGTLTAVLVSRRLDTSRLVCRHSVAGSAAT